MVLAIELGQKIGGEERGLHRYSTSKYSVGCSGAWDWKKNNFQFCTLFCRLITRKERNRGFSGQSFRLGWGQKERMDG